MFRFSIYFSWWLRKNSDLRLRVLSQLGSGGECVCAALVVCRMQFETKSLNYLCARLPRREAAACGLKRQHTAHTFFPHVCSLRKTRLYGAQRSKHVHQIKMIYEMLRL